MVHRGSLVVVQDGLPGIALYVVVKHHWRRLGRLSVKANPCVVVNLVAASREIGFALSVRPASGNAIPRRSGVRRQLAPGDLLWILAVNLAHPAFIGRNVPRPRWGLT